VSLLTIVADVCNELGIAEPTSVYSNSDQTIKQLLALSSRVGKDLMSMHEWTVLQNEHTFNTVNGTASYALPSDFDRFMRNSWWDRANDWRLIGPMNADQWQVLKSGIGTSGPRRRFRVKGNSSTKFFIDPTPEVDSETLAFEYISKKWVSNAAGDTFYTEWQADDDESLFGDTLMILGLKLKFFSIKGFSTDDLQDQFDKVCSQMKGSDGGAPTLSLTPQRHSRLIGPANVPDTGFGS
jgi:hypothetical protein